MSKRETRGKAGRPRLPVHPWRARQGGQRLVHHPSDKGAQVMDGTLEGGSEYGSENENVEKVKNHAEPSL